MWLRHILRTILSPPPQYQRARKKQQRVERQQQKDSERDAQRRSIKYTLLVQDVLNSMDDEAKENFKSGANGAVVSCYSCWIDAVVSCYSCRIDAVVSLGGINTTP